MSPRPSTPGDLTLHRSSRRNAVLAVVVGVAAAGGIPLALAGCAWVQVIGAIWLGLCAHALCGLIERARDRRAIVRIDARGILDTRVLRRPIEWWEIERLYALDVSRSQVVELQLRHPGHTLAGAPWHVRLGLGSHRALGLPDVCISVLLLDGAALDVIDAIRQHAPHLAPRSRVFAEQTARSRLRAAARPRWIGR